MCKQGVGVAGRSARQGGSYGGRGFQREKDPIVLCQVGKFGKKRFGTNKRITICVLKKKNKKLFLILFKSCDLLNLF